MSAVSRVDWLVAREVLTLALVIVAVVSSVMFVFRIFAFAEYVFTSQDALATVFLFLVFLFPTIFKLTMPLSLLLASVVVTLRMSQDREIEALMSCGASVLRLARAPTLLGFVGMVLSLYTGLNLEPLSREQMSRFKWMHAVRGIETFVESRLDEKTFMTDIFPIDHLDVSLFVDRLLDNPKGNMEGVLLTIGNPRAASQDEVILVARKGSIRKEMDKSIPDYVFRVEDGRLYQPVSSEAAAGGDSDLGWIGGQREANIAKEDQGEPKGAATVPGDAARGDRRLGDLANGLFHGPLPAHALKLLERAGDWDVFQFKELKLSIFSLFRRDTFSADDGEVNIRTLQPLDYLAELRKRRASPQWKRNKSYVRDHTYFYEALTVPLACLFLPAVGLSMGISDPRRRPGFAYLGVGIFVFIFYATMMICQQLALSYIVAPEMTLWLPPLVVLAMTSWVVRARLVYPPSSSIRDVIKMDFQACIARVRRRLGSRP